MTATASPSRAYRPDGTTSSQLGCPVSGHHRLKETPHASTAQCPFLSQGQTTRDEIIRTPSPPPISVVISQSQQQQQPAIVDPTEEHLSSLHDYPTDEHAGSEDIEITKGNFAHLYSLDLDSRSNALQRALRGFRPNGKDYAGKSYDEAFNWSTLTVDGDWSKEWYCVVFRSRRKKSSSTLSLYNADRAAHHEAISGGGLLMYWYGEPDQTGLNLATCIWRSGARRRSYIPSRAQAVAATKGPKHVQAMREASQAYEMYTLERWVLSKESRSEGLSVRPWTEGEVDLGEED